jgi:putative DNA primase/helicase
MENGMMSLELRSWQEAETRILGLIEECAEGGPCRLGEALDLAEEWNLDRDWVEERFRDAIGTAKEKLRRRAEEKRLEKERAAALLKRPATQLPVIEPTEIQPPKKDPKIAALQAEIRRSLERDRLRAKAKPLAEEAAIEPEPKVEPEKKAAPPRLRLVRREGGSAAAALVENLISQARAKAEPREEPAEEPERVGEWELPPFFKAGEIAGGADVILSPKGPYDNAREFAARQCWREGWLATYFWHEAFWRWDGQVYRQLAESDLRKEIYEFLDRAWKEESRDGNAVRVRFRPLPKNVSDVVDGLKSGLALDVDCYPPAWLDGGKAEGVLMFRNGLVEIGTGKMVPVTPRLWIKDALGYDWDETATCPRWERFLEEVFPEDRESQDFVEEWLGLGMTEDIRFEKGLMMIGEKPRGGRGTIMEVQKGLVGEEGYVGLSTHNWVKEEKSLEPLIGKKVGCFPDVRLKPGQWFGNNYVPGGLDPASVEWMLKITAGDTVSVARKYVGAWRGKLVIKLTLLSNVVPNLNDAVLPTRFHKLAFEQSWLGREDIELKKTLASELPGIAQRCLRAYRRLCERGRFIQPKSGLRLETKIASESDPFVRFVQTTFIPDPEASIEIGVAFLNFEAWCKKHGRAVLLEQVVKQNFVTKLRQVPGFQNVGKSFRPHGDPRKVAGLRYRTLKDNKEE